MSTERDPDAPPSEEELAESQRLREALEDPSKDHPGADLLRAVKSAAAPKLLDAKELEASVDRGLAKAKPASAGVVIRVVFGAGFIVAAAAAVALFLRQQEPSSAPALAHARSTQPLFVERFGSHGGESARIDRIALARASDLRENHFARWGVKERR
jgi:hypothetical protein